VTHSSSTIIVPTLVEVVVAAVRS